MASRSDYIKEIDENPPVFEDLLRLALQETPGAPAHGLPPLRILERVMQDVHMARLDDLRVGKYLADNRARVRGTAVHKTLTRREGAVTTRLASRRIHDVFTSAWRPVHDALSREYKDACRREINRYQDDLEYAHMIYAADEGPAVIPHEGDDELESEGEDQDQGVADDEVIDEDELTDAAEE